MKIEDPKMYAKGFVRVEEKGGWTHFDRFFEAQLPVYRNNMMFAACSGMSAGIRLVFLTDADTVEFTVKSHPVPFSFRALFGSFDMVKQNDKMPKFQPAANANSMGTDEMYGVQFDCLVNDRLIASSKVKKGKVSFALGNEDHSLQRVEIVFPYMRSVDIRELQLLGCGRCDSVKDREKVLFLGDSITQSADCVHAGKAWPQLLARQWDADYVNQGVCGYIFCPESLEGLDELREEVTRVICGYGTNDWQFASAAKKEFRTKQMRDYFRRLHALFDRQNIYVITPMRRLDEKVSRTFYSMEEWRRMIAEEAGKYENVTVIDGSSLMPEDASFFYDGYIHPNDAGAAYIIDRLLTCSW